MPRTYRTCLVGCGRMGATIDDEVAHRAAGFIWRLYPLFQRSPRLFYSRSRSGVRGLRQRGQDPGAEQRQGSPVPEEEGRFLRGGPVPGGIPPQRHRHGHCGHRRGPRRRPGSPGPRPLGAPQSGDLDGPDRITPVGGKRVPLPMENRALYVAPANW